MPRVLHRRTIQAFSVLGPTGIVLIDTWPCASFVSYSVSKFSGPVGGLVFTA